MPLKMFQKEEPNPRSTVRHVIAVAAGKGGVGKSTITVNLALALQQLKYKVGILDADIYGPSVRKMLPEERLPSQQGQQLFPAHCQGIKMISMAYFCKDGKASGVRAPIANSIIGQFINNIVWGDLDYLLIDFPPGTGDIQLTLSQQGHLTGAIMVTTPQEVAVLDVRKAIHLFGQVNIPILGIVENMSYYMHPSSGEKLYLFGEGGGERLSKEYNAPLLGTIPIDPVLSERGDKGQSIFGSKDLQEAPIATAFIDLAYRLVSGIEGNTVEQGLQDFELNWKEM